MRERALKNTQGRTWERVVNKLFAEPALAAAEQVQEVAGTF